MNRYRTLRLNRGDLYELFICLLLAGLFVLLSSGAAFAQGNVGINNPTPHVKSLLDLTSTDKGLLTPRMTAAQRTAMFPAPDATGRGMLVYQTDGTQGFYYYDGAAWQMMQAGGADWGLLGNAGTSPATNFIGTTDNQGLALRTNNTERLRIEAGGNVGIGTATPTRPLEVASANQAVQRLSSANTVNGSVLELRNTTAGDQTLGAFNFMDGLGTRGQLSYHLANGMIFNAGAAERMRITIGGNVGIGTTAPAAPLHVVHGQAGASTMLVQNTNAGGWSGINFLGNTGAGNSTVGYDNTNQNGYFGTTTAHPVTFITSWQERMRIDPAGNVGIGTGAPGRKLHVVDAGVGVVSAFQGTNPAGYSVSHWLRSDNVGAHVGFFNPGVGVPMAGNFVMGSFGNAPVSITTNNVERIRVATDGNVGIGTSSPFRMLEIASANQAVQRLTSSNAVNGSVLELRNTTAGNNILGALNFLDGTATRGQLAYHLADGMTFTTTAGERMRITATGNVGIGTSAPTSTLEVNGYTKLGSNAPAVRMLKLTGTTPASQGAQIDIPHGLTASKILSVDVLIEGAGNWIPDNYLNTNGYQINFMVTNTVIKLWSVAGNSFSVLSKPVKILITYEA